MDRHLTPIRAVWHLIHELMVISQYPEVNCNEARAIDILEPEHRGVVCQLQNEFLRCIMVVSIVCFRIQNSFPKSLTVMVCVNPGGDS